MSGQTASSIKEVVIYVPLLNEGTDVLRPTTGVILQPDIVRISATRDYDPDVEEWEFRPGSTVKCVREFRSGREILVARQLVA